MTKVFIAFTKNVRELSLSLKELFTISITSKCVYTHYKYTIQYWLIG